jgi:hypothetical protein
MLLVGAAVGAAFMLSHLYRTANAHEADDQEERCRSIEELGESEPGQLSACLTRLTRLRAAERAREAPPTRTLDSARQSP